VGPSARGDVWIYDLGGTAQPLKLTFQGHNIFPIWSPDGKRVVFLSPAGSSNHMFSIPADGSATEPESLTTSESTRLPLAWSPDGAFVLFNENSGQTRADLQLLQVSDKKTRPWLQTPFSENEGRFSSDGGRNPVWSADGKELFYDNGPKVLSARVVSEVPDFRVETPRMLFEGGFVQGSMRNFDVAPDGRFVMIEANATTATSASIVVVQNWFEDLKRIAPKK
jgi:Tol biopolymer transport system component